MAAERGLVSRVARWCVQHHGRVLIIWLVVIVAAVTAYSGVGTRAANQFSLSGTESQRAKDLLQQSFPAQSGDVDQIVFRARQDRIADHAMRARIEPMRARVARLPHVSGVVGPYAAGTRQISADGRIAFATVTFNKQAPALSKGDGGASDLDREARSRA